MYKVKLRNMMNSRISELNINECGCFDDLKNIVDTTKAKDYIEKLEEHIVPPFEINIKVDNLPQSFIIGGIFEV